MIFKWKKGSHIAIDPQAAGDELKQLERKRAGKLKPVDVVQEARSKNSPLHDAFDWDDKAAADKFRIVQANYLLRSLITVVVNLEAPDEVRYTRVYVSVHPPDDSLDKTYRALTTVLNDAVLRQQMLESALDEFRVWRNRYSSLLELAEIFDAGNLVIGKLTKVKAA